jgi:hypothetical protein
MQVKTGDRIYLDARAQADPADSVVTPDYCTQLPQIRLTGNSTGHRMEPETTAEVMLDGNDVAELVECAIRHPAVNMRCAVLAAIWNHPDSFRQIFQFGLEAPLAFSEIREIVAKELGKHSVTFDLRPRTRSSRPAKRCCLGCPCRRICEIAKGTSRGSVLWADEFDSMVWEKKITARVTGASSQAILRL